MRSTKCKMARDPPLCTSHFVLSTSHSLSPSQTSHPSSPLRDLRVSVVSLAFCSSLPPFPHAHRFDLRSSPRLPCGRLRRGRDRRIRPPRHHRGHRRGPSGLGPRARPHRQRLAPGRAPGPGRPLGPGVQHRRGALRHRPRGPGPVAPGPLPDSLHVLRPAGHGPFAPQGDDQGRRPQCRDSHARLRRDRAAR